ncbi:Efflux pump FUS6 [Paramyrothecium foliicola]|nr:Efflux pump FUS6 [Paramyrothecium foliicola]
MIITLIKRYCKPRFKTAKGTDPTSCAHHGQPSCDPCTSCKAEKRSATKYRWTIVLGLVLPFALQALDATIIASALPWIANDFGESSQFNWIASAFNLTSAAFIPFWGQMADVFGRNACLNGSLVLMLVGSALCTGAPSNAFSVLLLGRGFQGVAAAGLNVIVRTILADRVTLAENAKNWTILAYVGGISYSAGPVVGGYLTKTDWRWCFAINLPIALAALVIAFFVLRKKILGPQPIVEAEGFTGLETPPVSFVGRLKTIDLGGQILFLFGFGLVVLALTWGGVSYPWNSSAVLCSLIVGCFVVGCFVAWERLLSPGKYLRKAMPWQSAMVPWVMLKHKDIGLIWWSDCASGIAQFAILFFCNIYFIAVKGRSAEESGVQLLYFVPGLGVGVILCSLLCNTWPRVTFPPVFLGTGIETIGIGLLAWALFMERTSTIYGMMALVGVGIGLRIMAAPLHGLGIFRNDRASVISLLSLAGPFGGTLGLTVMSTVFNNVSGLSAHQDSFLLPQGLTEAGREEARHNAKMGVVWAFVAITPLMLSAWLCTCLIGNVRLNKQIQQTEGFQDSDVVEGVYIWKLITGVNADKTTRDSDAGNMNNREAQHQDESPEPKLWLEFRTFDDGLSAQSATAKHTPSPATFPQFGQLPTELRLKIWAHLVQPRVIVVCCLQKDREVERRRHELARRTRGAGVPTLLHVNHEARCVGLRHYELTFSWKISKIVTDTPVSRPAQVYFNFALDALYLTGELEAFDSNGFNLPMVYFLRREDTQRVRHIACAFVELGYPEQESDQVYSCLWHVVDRFKGVDRLLLTVDDSDEEQMRGCLLRTTDNVIQKIWNGWRLGTTVTNSTMANKQMLLVKEDDLAEFVASHQGGGLYSDRDKNGEAGP